MTFSIVARSDDGESWGIAVASKFLAVGSAVPAAAAGVGAIATQADANLAYKYLGLAHLDEAVERDLRVDDHPDPVTELARLVDLNDLYLTASTPDEQVPIDDELMAELEAHARAHGHEHFREWVGSENYEMRVAPGLRPAWIDQRILDIVRGADA